MSALALVVGALVAMVTVNALLRSRNLKAAANRVRIARKNFLSILLTMPSDRMSRLTCTGIFRRSRG